MFPVMFNEIAQDLLFVRFLLVDLIGETEEAQWPKNKGPHGKSRLHWISEKSNMGSWGEEREREKSAEGIFGIMVLWYP